MRLFQVRGHLDFEMRYEGGRVPGSQSGNIAGEAVASTRVPLRLALSSVTVVFHCCCGVVSIYLDLCRDLSTRIRSHNKHTQLAGMGIVTGRTCVHGAN